MRLEVERLIDEFIESDSTDLHVAADNPPYIRMHGSLFPMEGEAPIPSETVKKMTKELVGDANFAKFRKERELDMALTVKGDRRMRINLYFQQGTIAWALRLLPPDFFPIEKLGIPLELCRKICALHQGLVLVTGATGSGKSTTLASIINEINKSRKCHIFTIEDPIEYKHISRKSFVSQREVGEDTKSFHEALRRVLREDPDVVLIGEMRDRETMAAALTLAETGHLTVATLHTAEAVQTITRIIGAFPPNEQSQIRTQLAATLQVVLSQQLVPWINENGRSLAVEIMIATPAVKAIIREDKVHQLPSVIQTGGNFGMRTMNQSLADFVADGKINKKIAMAYSLDKEDMERKIANL